MIKATRQMRAAGGTPSLSPGDDGAQLKQPGGDGSTKPEVRRSAKSCSIGRLSGSDSPVTADCAI
jgi:hypothetical protein